jgi:hypothetical protein
MTLMERVLNFQRANATIRFIVKQKGMGSGELYWAAITRAISVKDSLQGRD